MAQVKRCGGCGVEKLLAEFYPHQHGAFGVRGRCIECMRTPVVGPGDEGKVKQCKLCRVEKPLAEFHRRPYGTHGRAASCKQCRRERNHHRACYLPEAQQYEEMFKKQKGRCAICKQPEARRRLSLDHNHATREARKLLCSRCNFGLGFFQDNPKYLRAAAVYLETSS